MSSPEAGIPGKHFPIDVMVSGPWDFKEEPSYTVTLSTKQTRFPQSGKFSSLFHFPSHCSYKQNSCFQVYSNVSSRVTKSVVSSHTHIGYGPTVPEAFGGFF